MYLSFLTYLILPFFLFWNQVQYSELIGSWQLTYFDGIENIVKSADYQNASSAQRANMDAKIKYRLESTVYQFVEGDTLKFIDFVNQKVVQKTAKVELRDGEILVIHEEDQDRLAKIIELTPQKLVLLPISATSKSGKMVFERIPEKK
ncbi:hypothetical protein [Algoriphagus mannitolivorans]|uniref:hypothetical protein n=1 Tax=Algoriphagus mannitolivorans TaxID=226504 RepID=UPI000425B586|nr:hypothetical protein [Algoriphagus mannitolivorans]